MFCPNCGTSLPEGSKFCGNCGQPLAQAAAPTDAWTPSEAGPVPPQQAGFAQDVPYTQSAYEPAPPVAYDRASGQPTPVRNDRSLVVYILLSLVTCGLYGYWFIYQLAQDANAMCEGDGEETPGLLAYFGLSLVTCGLYSYYWLYKLANRLQANAPRYQTQIQESGSDVLMWLLLGYLTCGICTFVGMNIVITNSNKLATSYNRAYNLA